MKKEPLVSIGIPVYDTEYYVYGAIKSSLIQTYKNIEVIVVDDASTDETSNICKSFGDEIRYIRNEKNMGIGYGRWKIVNEAKGDYIVFCSADDIMSNQFVEVMLEEATKHPDNIIYCGYFIVDKYGKVTGEYSSPSFEGHDDFCVSCYESALRNTMFINFSCVMIPRKVFEKVNFEPKIRFGEDLDFLFRSIKHFKYKCVPMMLVKYRHHEGMVTNQKWYEIEENSRKILGDCIKYWEGGK